MELCLLRRWGARGGRHSESLLLIFESWGLEILVVFRGFVFDDQSEGCGRSGGVVVIFGWRKKEQVNDSALYLALCTGPTAATPIAYCRASEPVTEKNANEQEVEVLRYCVRRDEM